MRVGPRGRASAASLACCILFFAVLCESHTESSLLIPAARQGHGANHRAEEGGFSGACEMLVPQEGVAGLGLIAASGGSTLQRGKTVPEELVKPEELSKYRQVASHVVSTSPRLAYGLLSRALGPPLPADLLGPLPHPSSGFPQNTKGRGPQSGHRSLCSLPGVARLELQAVPWPLGLLTSFVLSAKGLHSASIPGILALDLCPSDTNKILTGEPGLGPGQSAFSSTGSGQPGSEFSSGSSPGGADKNVVVFDKSSEQILATLKGHTKKVTSVVFHPSQVRDPSQPGTSCLPRGRHSTL